MGRDFLREDGFIAVAIDHYELFYLGVLMDEIFGRENRLGIISVIIKPEGRQFSKFISVSNEYLLIYSKCKERAKFNNVILKNENRTSFNLEDSVGKYKLRKYINYNPIKISGRKKKPEYWYSFYVSQDLKNISLEKRNDYIEVLPIENGLEKTWQTKKDKALERINNKDLVVKKEEGNYKLYLKIREDTGERILSVWMDKKYNANTYGTKLLEKIIGRKGVSYPKSLYTVLDTLKIMTDEDDIILDFFAGSGTTGHAALALNKEDGGNRRFILVEQLDEHIVDCIERNQKVLEQENIKDSFIYSELARWNEKYMQDIKGAGTSQELLNIYERMKKESFFRYEIDLSKFDEQEFAKLSIKEQKQVLCECLDKNHLYVNLSEIDDVTYKISDEDKKLNKEFYGQSV